MHCRCCLPDNSVTQCVLISCFGIHLLHIMKRNRFCNFANLNMYVIYVSWLFSRYTNLGINATVVTLFSIHLLRDIIAIISYYYLNRSFSCEFTTRHSWTLMYTSGNVSNIITTCYRFIMEILQLSRQQSTIS